MADKEKVIKGLDLCSNALYCADPSSRCDQCPYRTKDMRGTDEMNCSDVLMADALALLKEQGTVGHALDVLRANGWKEESCEKCPLLTAVSDGVHEMAQRFRMGGEARG